MIKIAVLVACVWAGYQASWLYAQWELATLDDPSAAAAVGVVWWFFYRPIGLVVGLLVGLLFCWLGGKQKC